MRPADPRTRAQLTVARRPLAVVVAAGVAGSLLVIGQAFAVAALLVAVVGRDSLLVPAVAVAAVFASRAVVGAVADLAAARAAGAVTADMRRRITAATIAGSTRDLSRGELAALATRGVSAAEPYLTRYLPALVLAAVLPVLTVVALATQDLLAAVIVMATLPLVPVFGALVGLATRDRAEAQWRAMASLSGHFVDVMRGLPTLVAFRRAKAQSGTIRAVTNRYREATVKTLRIAFASAAVLELVATLSVALVAVVVGVRMAGGGLDLRTGLVVLLLAPEAYWPLRRVGAEFHAAAEGAATFERLSALCAASPDPASSGSGRLVAHGLGFTYPGRSVPAVRDLSLRIEGRGLTVLAGPSGCGKSTLLALLAGLLAPTEGTLATAARPEIAWVPQRPAFLPGTVAENLRLGRPSAVDHDLWHALERVALSERIASLGGLDAVVGEDARLLSAGERARLALARAIVSGRPWLFLDEPTAHLDPLTRAVLLDVIVEESRERGVVVVAHDPETLGAADRVVWLPARPIHSAPSESAACRTLQRTTRAENVRQDGPPTACHGFGLGTALGSLASLSGVALTATAGWLIVRASEHPPVLMMLVAIVGVRAFGLGRPVLRYAERLRSHDAALRLLAERRARVYDAVVPLTPGRLGRSRGDVLASMVDDVDATLDRQLRVRLPLRSYGAVVLVTTAVTTVLAPVAGLVIGSTSALGALAGYLVARTGCARAGRDAIAERGELSAAVLQIAEVADELRMWQAEPVARRSLERIADRLARASRRTAAATALARAAVLVSVAAGVLGSAILLAGDHGVGGPVAALLVLVPLALGEIALPVVDAGSLEHRVRTAEARLASYAAMSPAVREPRQPLPPAPRTDVDTTGDLTLGWVRRPVLTGLRLHVEPGERIAIVGPSGCGKSTLAATLIRFIDPLAGAVRLGSRGLDELALDDVRERIGLVDDDPHVFASTLAENVRLARPGASDADVLAALQAAHLGAWVASLPDGLRTWVGDGHAQLSGGERARLGLARSILADQPVLVLDEPVAHLDHATATEVAQDLLDGAGDRTIVWITHSDVGVDRTDRVVDLGAVSTQPVTG